MIRKEKREDTNGQDRNRSDDITTDSTEQLLNFNWNAVLITYGLRKKYLCVVTGLPHPDLSRQSLRPWGLYCIFLLAPSYSKLPLYGCDFYPRQGDSADIC